MSFGIAARNRVRQYSCAHSNSVWFRCWNRGIDTVEFLQMRHVANNYAAGQLRDESQQLKSGDFTNYTGASAIFRYAEAPIARYRFLRPARGKSQFPQH